MAIPYAALPEGTRVKIVQGQFPQDPALIGKTGTVISASEYQAERIGVVLDSESVPRYFAVTELKVTSEPLLPPERETAKARRALP
ncbi:MAG: hypothetical protein WEE89_02820 [Gemmatimonadota bacterium]